MLNFEYIKQQYPSNIHTFERGILREYLQFLILDAIFSHPLSNKLSFLGGTALRIVYGINRFSEDLDFDNKDLSIIEFNDIAKHIQKTLEKEGLEVEIRVIEKMSFHCYIKFPELLYKEGLSPLPDEKILISIDTFDQGVTYKPEVHIIDKFEIFKRILVTPKSIILSQKLWTITQRKRAKGRDFYDAMVLLSQTTPDKDFLEKKFGFSDWSKIKEQIMNHVDELDFEQLKNDVAPFLVKSSDAEKILLFKEYLNQLSA